MNRAVQLASRCWEVASEPDPDSGWPHCATEHEAHAMVGEYDALKATATLLPAPCWEALCGSCGGDMVDVEGYSHVHHASRADAEDGYGVACEDGCESAGPDPLAPSTAGMEPIPGIGGVA